MARGLENYPNVTTPDSDYPSARIKDNPGDNSGTPVSEETYGDIHQFFAKLLRSAIITPNGLPDNEYNRNQYYEAAIHVLSHHRPVIIIDGPPSTLVIESNDYAMVIFKDDLAVGHALSINRPTGNNSGAFGVFNYQVTSVQISTAMGEDIGGAASPFILAAGQGVEFLWSAGTSTWTKIREWRLTPIASI